MKSIITHEMLMNCFIVIKGFSKKEWCAVIYAVYIKVYNKVTKRSTPEAVARSFLFPLSRNFFSLSEKFYVW